MGYYDTLTSEQKKNIADIVDEAKKGGITNPYSIAAMLAIVSKESSFIPQSENLRYTSADRISKVFGLSSSSAAKYVNNPEALANRVYGNRFGNTAPGDGWKYRGRGYNQLTFKGNYQMYKDLVDEDIVGNPDRVNDSKVAAKVLIQYFKKNFQKLKENGNLSAYNATDINDFKNLADSTLAFYHANAGPSKPVEEIKRLRSNDPYGGMTKAFQRVEELYNNAITAVKKKPVLTILTVATLTVAVWILYKYSGLAKKINT